MLKLWMRVISFLKKVPIFLHSLVSLGPPFSFGGIRLVVMGTAPCGDGYGVCGDGDGVD